jgi:hypothetical protein
MAHAEGVARGHAKRTRERHHEVAAGDQRLLVGRGNDLAALECSKDRLEADHAGRADEDEVNLIAGGDLLQRLWTTNHARRPWRERGRDGLIGQGDHPRPVSPDLIVERRDVVPGCERHDLEAVGVRGKDV